MEIHIMISPLSMTVSMSVDINPKINGIKMGD